MKNWIFLSIWIFLGSFGKGTLSQWMSESSLPDYPKCLITKELSEPSGQYRLNEDIWDTTDFCLYIRNQAGTTLSITFLDFNFGFEDENGNCTNFLAMRSMEETPPSQPKKYCGSRHPPPFVTNAGIVWIWVHREYMMRNTNIELRYSTASKCNGDVELTSYTFLTSPRYSNPVVDCDWTVTLSQTLSNQPLQIQLTKWIVQNSAASLEIYDSRGGQFLARFDETTSFDKAKNVVITTQGPHAYVVYHSYGLGISNTEFNATVKVKGFCIPGTLSCGDGENCYSHDQFCNSQQDCSTGYDELGCGDCKATEFWCGNEDGSCYNIEQRCNGFKDCPRSLQDETNCKTCGPGSFSCKSDNKCIYERWRCDGDFDCSDGSDERDCDYTASRRVITAAVIGSLVCSLLLVIALGCTCKLYSLRASHHRHSYHNYRATPLTRVERELFQRQAPPTYDMTVTGTSAETTSNTRSQRQRRRRNRRYQFQRAAPATSGVQSNNSSREESIESVNNGPSTTGATSTPPPPTTGSPTTAPPPTSTEEQTTRGQQTASAFVLESIPDILAEMILAPRQGQTNSARQNAGLTPVRTSTPVPIETRESGTQTNSNASNTPTTTAAAGQTPTTSSVARSTRSTSRSRGRNRRSPRGSANSNTKDQQAKPLPKKKRILPVMVQAPCPDAVVEEDTLACVYPCPPSYSQAVASDDPKVENSVSEETQNPSPSSGSINEEQDETTDQVFAPVEENLTTSRSRFFPFSIGQALRSLTSFPRFHKHPYLQMEAQDVENNESEDQTCINSYADADNSTVHRPMRPSTSSDECMLDCTFDTESLGPNNELQDMSSVNQSMGTNTMTSGNKKVFPSRKNNVNPFNAAGDSSSHDTSLDMSDLLAGEEK